MCAVCAREAAAAVAANRAELMPRLAPYFPNPEESTDERAA